MSEPFPPIFPASVQNDVVASRDRTRADKLADARGTIDSHTSGAVDPDYVSSLEAFDGMTHERIYEAVERMNSGSLNNAAMAWSAVQSEFSANVTWGTAAAMKEIAGWTGDGANAANAALSAVMRSGFETEQVMTSVSSRLHQAGFAVDAIKAAVPPPEQSVGLPQTLLDIIDPKTPLETKAAAERAEELRQQAIRAMNDIYVPTLKPVGDAVPAFVAPNDPTSGVPGVDASGGGVTTTSGWSIGGGGGGSAGMNVGALPAQNHSTTPDSATAADRDATTGNDSAASSGADGVSSPVEAAGALDPTSASALDPASAGPGATTPASYTPTGSAADRSSIGGGVAGGGHAGGAGGVGGSGSGAFGGLLGSTRARRNDQKRNGTDGVTGLGVGALGGAMAGALTAGGETFRSGPSVAAAAKSAAPAGFVPGSRGKSGEDDKEHETPSYLITAGHGNELIGDIAPTAPPVLGTWDSK